MKRLQAFLTVLWIMLLSFACQEDPNDPIIVANLEQEVQLSLEEVLGTPDAVRFRLTTFELADCLNYGIDIDFERTGNTLNLQVNEILAPPDCLPGSAPAKGSVIVQGLTPGLYNLTVDLKGVSPSVGSLYVLTDRYLLSMEEAGEVGLLREEVLQVPPQSFWGFVQWETEAGRDLAQAFLATLRAEFAEREAEAGHYSYFEVVDGKPVLLDPLPPSPSAPREYFLLGLDAESNLALLRDLVSQYRQEATAGELTLSILTSQGMRI